MSNRAGQIEKDPRDDLGTPTRFGNMAAQMRNFLDCTGERNQARARGRSVVSF